MKIYKVGIYLRLSIEDKNKNTNESSESIKNQRNLLLEEINKHNDYVLYDEYIDEDLSGAGTYRKEFERLIKDCEDKKIDIVLCKSQSRFSRDMEIIERYIHNKFLEWNVRFIGLADNADTNNIGNKKARQINGLVNEWYLEDVSSNIRSAFNAKMKNGEFISPFAPFGYVVSSIDNNKLEIDLEASLIVKKIFKLYLEGFGYSKIADILNNEKVPSPSYYKYLKGIKLNVISKKQRDKILWNSNSIKTILNNEIYIGNLIQGKRTTVSYKNHKIIKKDKNLWVKSENVIPPIIDKNTFNKVKDIVLKRNRPVKNGSIHLFSKKVYCDSCSSFMKKKSSSKYNYLVCSKDKCPNKIGIRYEELESIILSTIKKIINENFEKNYLDTFKNNCLNNYNNNNEINNLKNSLEKQINDNNLYIKNLYIDKVKGNINENQFNMLLNDFTNNKKLLNKKLTSVNKQINNIKYSDLDVNKYRDINKINRYIINTFVDKICVGLSKNNKRDINVYMNF